MLSTVLSSVLSSNILTGSLTDPRRFTRSGSSSSRIGFYGVPAADWAGIAGKAGNRAAWQVRSKAAALLGHVPEHLGSGLEQRAVWDDASIAVLKLGDEVRWDSWGVAQRLLRRANGRLELTEETETDIVKGLKGLRSWTMPSSLGYKMKAIKSGSSVPCQRDRKRT